MNTKIWKFCRYLVSVALVLDALTDILYSGLQFDGLTFYRFLQFISYVPIIVIAVAIFTSAKAPFMIGCGIQGLVSVLYVLYPISYGGRFNLMSSIHHLATAVCYVLIAISLSHKKSQEKIIPIAIIVGIVGASLYNFWLFGLGNNASAISIIRSTLSSCSSCIKTHVYLLIGILALEVKNVPIADKKFISAPTKNPIETITKLKELLDVGAISQEEFDEKKKKLLNL